MRRNGLATLTVEAGPFVMHADRVDWGEPDADGWRSPRAYDTFNVTARRHPEETCHRCGGPNIWSWHVASPVWNAVMRARPEWEASEHRWGGIVCPTCFAQLAHDRGVVPRETATWCLRPDPMPDVPMVNADGRAWRPSGCCGEVVE